MVEGKIQMTVQRASKDATEGQASWSPPVDPGDAGGVGNGAERNIAPDTLHEAVEDVPALEEAARRAGRP